VGNQVSSRLPRLLPSLLTCVLIAASVAGSGPLAARADVGIPPANVPAGLEDAVYLRRPNPVEARTIEFRGLIQEMQERYWVVSGRVVLITEDSHVQGSPQIGALAEVKGLSMFGDVVLATSIGVALPGAYDPVDLEGALESMQDTVWVVGGVTVTLNSVTVIEGTPALGLVVEVHGVLHPDGSVLAERVAIRGPTSAPQIDIAGLVEYILPTQWTVAGTAVFIDERSLIDDSRAPAEAGMWAQVRARRGREGSLVAVRIRLSRPE
jgi:hypothetical protein